MMHYAFIIAVIVFLLDARHSPVTAEPRNVHSTSLLRIGNLRHGVDNKHDLNILDDRILQTSLPSLSEYYSQDLYFSKELTLTSVQQLKFCSVIKQMVQLQSSRITAQCSFVSQAAIKTTNPDDHVLRAKFKVTAKAKWGSQITLANLVSILDEFVEDVFQKTEDCFLSLKKANLDLSLIDVGPIISTSKGDFLNAVKCSTYDVIPMYLGATIFEDYGCFCGTVASSTNDGPCDKGSPVDATDTCCQNHDLDWRSPVKPAGCTCSTETDYEWRCVKILGPTHRCTKPNCFSYTAVCDENEDACAKYCCEKDTKFANCLKEASPTQNNRKYKNYSSPDRCDICLVPTQAPTLFPIGTPIQSSPVDTPIQSSPVDTPIQSSPVDTPSQSSPVDTPSQSSPVGTPTQSSPVDTPSQSSPVDTPTVTSPVDNAPSKIVPSVPVDVSPSTLTTAQPALSPAQENQPQNVGTSIPTNKPAVLPPTNDGEPSETPLSKQTIAPTSLPTVAPIGNPIVSPFITPTSEPKLKPVVLPAASPLDSTPVEDPTVTTNEPAEYEGEEPSSSPSCSPSDEPTLATESPAQSETFVPAASPLGSTPVEAPAVTTNEPTYNQGDESSCSPSVEPTPAAPYVSVPTPVTGPPPV